MNPISYRSFRHALNPPIHHPPDQGWRKPLCPNLSRFFQSESSLCVLLLMLVSLPSAFAASPNQSPAPSPATLTDEQAQALVRQVLKTELEATHDLAHPMQYCLRKTSPRISTTKQIVETRDGDVARLVAVNNASLSTGDQQTEDARLNALLANPGQQHHRQEREQGDAERARKIIRALPDAFRYTFIGVVDTPQGPTYRLSFEPNPDFDPQDIEAQALKAMAGELWINVAGQRVSRLEGKRLHDVDYGWGLIGKLQQGGTLLLEQADIGNHQWRTTHMVLEMNARIFFKTVKLDTTLDLTKFTPVSKDIDYRAAIHLLQAHPEPAGQGQ